MLSWQEAHAAREGAVYQTGASAAGAAWQVLQLRMSCGNTTVEKSLTDWALPMMTYGLPALTLGRLLASWILWIRTLKSTVLPVSGSVVWGLWQVTQSFTSMRDPPWAESGLWQVLQAACGISSHFCVTGWLSGLKSYSTFAK